MNANQRKQLLREYIGTAAYFREQISDVALEMYVDDLADLPLEAVLEALRGLRRDPKQRRSPLPSEIRAKVLPASESPEEIGKDIASRIIEAVSTCGWTNAERAKARIGELGWIVVQRQGGWTNLCSELNESNRGMIQAQMRDLATVLYRKAEMGTLNLVPQLPEQKHRAAQLVSLIKDMPKPEGQ